MYFCLYPFLPYSLIHLKFNASLEKSLTRLKSVRSTHISFAYIFFRFRYLAFQVSFNNQIHNFQNLQIPNFLVIKELMRQLAMFFILGIMIYGKFQLDRGLYYRISIISLSPD